MLGPGEPVARLLGACMHKPDRAPNRAPDFIMPLRGWIALLPLLGAALWAPPAPAQQTVAQQAEVQQAEAPAQLQTVEVTGTRIRRVDSETSNPVLTIGAKEIQASGANTLGDLLQSLPVVSGQQTNAQYNGPPSGTGGGPSGAASDVGLRGLTSSRTLLLLDGQRLVSSDINVIPLNMIDHIDILKQGASAVYGADAIAGVVNIITVKKTKGLDLAASYGETQRGDGGIVSANLTWGRSEGHNKLVLGLALDQTQPIYASNRAVSAEPYGFADGQIADLGQGSINAPNGAIILPINAIAEYGCSTAFPVLTRIAGTNGSNRLDFRCFNDSPFSAQGSDLYNYQPANYLTTPATRESLFATASHGLAEGLDWIGEAYFTHTHARNQLAPETLALGGVSAIEGQNIVISPLSLYNPFTTPIGINLNVDGLFSSLFLRNNGGDRLYISDRDTYQLTTGLKGTLLDRFDWSALFSYGEELSKVQADNFEDLQPLLQGLGPSFMSLSGVPTCGTALNPIPNCTPIDLIGTQGATPASLLVDVNNHETTQLERAVGDISGDLFTLWAGPVGAELGYEFRRYQLSDTPSQLAEEGQLFEGNQGATKGAYSVNEVYGELLVPLLRDLPLVHALNVDLGARFSKNSAFSSSENNKFALEYRPVADLLIRATYADIFRAPTIQDLFGGFSQVTSNYVDPCNGFSTSVASATAGQNAACMNVARDGSYDQLQPDAGSEVTSNPQLKPETGYTSDFGLVYSPHWYGPLTVDADYWHYTVKNAINQLSLQDSLNACFNFDEFCQDVVRDNSGQISKTYAPEINSDRFDTVGLDFGIHLSYPHTAWGAVLFNLDSTYLQKFDYKVMPGGETVEDDSVAGTYNANVFDGGFPRLRSYATLIWKAGPFSTTLADRFLGNVNEQVPANGTSCPQGKYENGNCDRRIGSANYVNLSETYTAKDLNTDFTFGVNDLTDRGALYAYSAAVPDTILSMYDVTGRFFYGRIKVHFQ
jgi:outer membrane receptor protein involved in Fe transport